MKKSRPKRENWIPVHVTRGKSAWEYRPVRGGRCVRLCALDSPNSLVIRRHAEEFERFHTKSGTFKALADDFFESEEFKKKAKSTQNDYQKYWEKVEPVFGKVDAKRIAPEHIRTYMDKKGKTSEVQANRHLSFMSKVFSWGFERGRVKINPCHGVTRYTETARDKYITDEEYRIVHDVAPVRVKIAMEISYLCAARQGDVLKLTKVQISDDGINIRQGKTGKKQIKAWTPRLKKAIELAKTLKSKHDSIYIIPTQKGTAYTSDGFRTMWHKAITKARKESKKPLDFTFHDIKAKGISDYEGDKQKFSGHKTASQVAIYDRKTEIVPTLDTD